MSKVAITGHTGKLGSALFARFSVMHEVEGYSRSNGYDIRRYDEIIQAAKHNDIFINNAYDRYSQVDLLYNLYKEWHNKDKIIVNISSIAPDGIKENLSQYASHKAALDNAHRQIAAKMNSCRVINIKPGYITEFDTLADTIYNIVHLKSPIAEVIITNG